MSGYNQRVAVVLTVEEWLDIKSAIRDARWYNQTKRYPATAEKQTQLLDLLNEQQTLNEAIDRADDENYMDQEARNG
jgi:hypothetical protein